MSVASHWGENRSIAAESNIPTLLDSLEDCDLLASGQLLDGSYSDRDKDRARLFRFITHQTSGILRTNLVHYVLKGVRYYPDGPGWNDFDGNELEAYLAETRGADGSVDLDGSDPDYQFAYNFTKTLENHDLVRLKDSPAGTEVHPTIAALDLISQGNTQRTASDDSPTHERSDEYVYDREFCRQMLRSLKSPLKAVSEPQKNVFANSLRRYIRRIENYKLVFDVHFSGSRGVSSQRMTKEYSTRWTSKGRQNKAWARYSQSLDWGYQNADNAVFATLTTDPKKHDTLLDAIEAINKNFNNLNQWLKTDPKTRKNTRRSDVLQWAPHLSQQVTGRPRKRLEYLKVLEFTEKGYPHLHVLFFDVPTRQSDGMPWLCDKDELSKKWDSYGQGRIVDLYPLVHRDDLDELGDFGTTLAYDSDGNVLEDADGNPVKKPVSEGFVCWYNYGDHDHDADWTQSKTRYHKEDGLIDMTGSDDVLREKTAGAYLGKYMGETFKLLKNPGEAFETGDFTHDGKAAWWKLALYWVTNRSFWTTSEGITDAIRLEDTDTHQDIQLGTHWATRLTLADAAASELEQDGRQKSVTKPKLVSAAHRVTTGETASADPTATADGLALCASEVIRETFASVEFLGAYAVWDLPATTTAARPIREFEAAAYDPETDLNLSSLGDRPPPISELYQTEDKN